MRTLSHLNDGAIVAFGKWIEQHGDRPLMVREVCAGYDLVAERRQAPVMLDESPGPRSFWNRPICGVSRSLAVLATVYCPISRPGFSRPRRVPPTHTGSGSGAFDPALAPSCSSRQTPRPRPNPFDQRAREQTHSIITATNVPIALAVDGQSDQKPLRSGVPRSRRASLLTNKRLVGGLAHPE